MSFILRVGDTDDASYFLGCWTTEESAQPFFHRACTTNIHKRIPVTLVESTLGDQDRPHYRPIQRMEFSEEELPLDNAVDMILQYIPFSSPNDYVLWLQLRAIADSSILDRIKYKAEVESKSPTSSLNTPKFLLQNFTDYILHELESQIIQHPTVQYWLSLVRNMRIIYLRNTE